MRTHSIGSNMVVYKHAFKAVEPEKKTEVLVTEPARDQVVSPPQKQRNEKLLPIVTAAVAVASLGVAAYALTSGKGKNKPLESLENKGGDTVKDAIEGTKKFAEDVKNELENKINDLTNRVTNTEGQGNKIDNAVNTVNDLVNKVNGVREEAQRALSETANKKHNFYTRPVTVNGQVLELAAPMHGYQKRGAELVTKLQTASSKRILGAASAITAIPALTTIRFMSAEFDGFAKHGGMAVVPKELVANIGAMTSDKQDVELIADTPLYLGPVNNSDVFELQNAGDNLYRYVKITPKGTTVMAELEEVGSFDFEMYDTEKKTEIARVYKTKDYLTAKVDFDSTINQLKPETAAAVRESLANGKTHTVGPLLFKPATDNNTVTLSLGKDGNVKVAYESFLKLFNDDAAKMINRFMESGKVVGYTEVQDMLKNYRADEEIIKMRAEGVDPSKFADRIERIKDKNNIIPMFKDGLKRGDVLEIVTNAEDAEKLEQYLIQNNKTVPDFKFIPKSPESVVTKYKAVFYENRRFRLDSPFDEKRDKEIYTDTAVESGETERFVTFAKLFYEHLLPHNQSHFREPMKADVVIGNDWQTGPLAAMFRLLTPAKYAFGLRKDVAEKLENMPMITLMHNFKLSGHANHSQEKLLNMMFGEHAAIIAENAYAPKDSKLPEKLLNGLFAYNGINAQTMAMAYSDYIPFVSVGNFNEASKDPARGGFNHELASLRGRTNIYENKEFIDNIAMSNQIHPDKYSAKPTAKGITNGCDRVNNIVTTDKARFMELCLNLPEGSLMTDADVQRLNNEGKNGAYIVHQNNKKVHINKVIEDLNLARETNGQLNPMKIKDFQSTDLTGVNEDTLIIGMAGRIQDQKGIDILTQGILNYYKNHEFDKENPPVFYIQGTGSEEFITGFLDAKKAVAKINKKAADRMIFANLFSEDGRYDACKMFSDFCDMPSWDEPCGLVHKEIAYFSGAIPIVNKTGGLTDGLRPYGVENVEHPNAIFVDFMDKDNHTREEALAHNGPKFGDGIATAVKWYSNKEDFQEGIKDSYEGKYDWHSGKIQQYVEILQDRGILSKEIKTK